MDSEQQKLLFRELFLPLVAIANHLFDAPPRPALLSLVPNMKICHENNISALLAPKRPYDPASFAAAERDADCACRFWIMKFANDILTLIMKDSPRQSELEKNLDQIKLTVDAIKKSAKVPLPPYFSNELSGRSSSLNMRNDSHVDGHFLKFPITQNNMEAGIASTKGVSNNEIDLLPIDGPTTKSSNSSSLASLPNAAARPQSTELASPQQNGTYGHNQTGTNLGGQNAQKQPNHPKKANPIFRSK